MRMIIVFCWLHYNQKPRDAPKAEGLHSCWRAGEALKCRWRGPSTVTCTKHFYSCRWNEPFQEVNCDVYQPTRQIGDDCSILTVSEWKQGIHPLSKRRLPSLPGDETTSSPPPSSPSSLDLESLFREMIYNFNFHSVFGTTVWLEKAKIQILNRKTCPPGEKA